MFPSERCVAVSCDASCNIAVVSDISAIVSSDVWETEMGSNNHHRRSTTELDSHANMVVVGAQATVVSRTGRLAEVRAFSDKCSKLEGIPIVDAAFAYDCPKTMQSYLLFVKNALYVHDMQHNLTLFRPS